MRRVCVCVCVHMRVRVRVTGKYGEKTLVVLLSKILSVVQAQAVKVLTLDFYYFDTTTLFLLLLDQLVSVDGSGKCLELGKIQVVLILPLGMSVSQ